MKIKLGIDVGNYDTKSQNTTTPSSYRGYENKNLLADEWLLYNGTYYTPTMERNNQQTDKMQNGYALIVSLFAISKEILYQIRRMNSEFSNEEVQAQIDKIDEVSIGVGLPVGFFSSLAIPMREEYLNNWKDGVSFVYNDFKFNFKLVSCSIMPQDFIAVACNDSVQIVKDFPDYYIIGIGGGTADVIPVVKGQPVVEKCISLEKGSTVMYSEIIKTMQHETGKLMEYETVETVLLNNPSVLDEDRKKRIKELSSEFANKLVDEFIHQGLRLSDYPSVFIGGGALLMKDALEKNPNFAKIEFIEDVNANAKYFANFAT